MTEHFTQWAWAGFAGRSLPAETVAAMQAHLDAGCQSCAIEAGFWKTLGSTLRQDREPLPPNWPQRLEKVLAYARAPRAQEVRARWAGVLGARLAFDNFTAPLPSAVRGV